jgi:hypothetical protein
MLYRITAIVLLLVVANGGVWIALSCTAGDSKPNPNDAETGDYCTIMCRAHGHDCVRESKEETCICPMDDAKTSLLNAMFSTPAVIQPVPQSAILFESKRTDPFKPVATMSVFLEFPSPPPKS